MHQPDTKHLEQSSHPVPSEDLLGVAWYTVFKNYPQFDSEPLLYVPSTFFPSRSSRAWCEGLKPARQDVHTTLFLLVCFEIPIFLGRLSTSNPPALVSWIAVIYRLVPPGSASDCHILFVFLKMLIHFKIYIYLLGRGRQTICSRGGQRTSSLFPLRFQMINLGCRAWCHLTSPISVCVSVCLSRDMVSCILAGLELSQGRLPNPGLPDSTIHTLHSAGGGVQILVHSR